MIHTIFSIGKQIINNISVFILIILLLSILSSCVANRIKEPSLGITYKFYTHKPQEIRLDAKYDFSRLEKGYGLLIFSYALDGFKDINRNENIIKKGVRIWEYKFSAQDEDINIITKNLTLFNVHKRDPIPIFFYLLPLEKDKKKKLEQN